MSTLIKNYQELANNIVIQACKDYKRALPRKDNHSRRTVVECEKFFLSGWFALLTKVDGKMLMQHIKKEVQNGRKTRSAYIRPNRHHL